MKYALVLAGALVLTTPAVAQTQMSYNEGRSAVAPVTIGSAIVTVAGVVAGVLVGDYLLGGTMAVRLASGIPPEFGRMGGMRGFPLGTGLLRPIVLAGSSILGGFIGIEATK